MGAQGGLLDRFGVGDLTLVQDKVVELLGKVLERQQ